VGAQQPVLQAELLEQGDAQVHWSEPQLEITPVMPIPHVMALPRQLVPSVPHAPPDGQ
jgi:hypothetical protein